jgi:hypothetical protein
MRIRIPIVEELNKIYERQLMSNLLLTEGEEKID